MSFCWCNFMLLVYLSHTPTLRQRVWWPFGLQLAWTCLEKSASFPFLCFLDGSVASHLPLSSPAWVSHHCFCLEKGWAWVTPIGGTQGALKWAGEKNIQRENENNNIPNATGKKKIKFCVSWVFSPIFCFCIFPLLLKLQRDLVIQKSH